MPGETGLTESLSSFCQLVPVRIAESCLCIKLLNLDLGKKMLSNNNVSRHAQPSGGL